MNKYLFNEWIDYAWKNASKSERPKIISDRHGHHCFSIHERVPEILIKSSSLVDPISGSDIYFKSLESIDLIISDYIKSWTEYFKTENLGTIKIKEPSITFKQYVSEKINDLNESLSKGVIGKEFLDSVQINSTTYNRFVNNYAPIEGITAPITITAEEHQADMDGGVPVNEMNQFRFGSYKYELVKPSSEPRDDDQGPEVYENFSND